MNRHTTPRMWPWAAALCLTVLVGAWPPQDEADIEADMAAERRELMHAIQHCHRAHGPATQPEYNDRGLLVCVSRRGEVLALVQPDAAAPATQRTTPITTASAKVARP